MAEPPEQVKVMRKSFACDECKRRKVRCSGGHRCVNCMRDAKVCRYSSPSQRLVSMQRQLRHSESIRSDMERAWRIHLPNVDLATALRNLPETSTSLPDTGESHQINEGQESFTDIDMTAPCSGQNPADDMEDTTGTRTSIEQSTTPPMEPTNAEDYEFDESLDVEGSIDGMGFLTADPHKAGYTGPPSGIASFKFLQSLPPYLAFSYSSPLTAPDDQDIPAASSLNQAAINRYIDDYFTLYHPAYPILHEGTFRARVSGALAKPRDGSWPLLYHSVLAIGAFVSGPSATKEDLPFYQEARKHLSMDMLEKGSLGYVQAMTLFANYLQKRNKPNAGFILIGIAFSMALAIGLHREFDTHNTSPFTMELRRRVWWTLFVFVSGAQLALGRPAASLVGVNVQLPANLNDTSLAVDMDQIPPCQEEQTVSSCLIGQVKLAKIANVVHDELLTHRRPSYNTAMKLEQRIRTWWSELPRYFHETNEENLHLEFPKRVLLWRSYNLRIVLNRPFLFENIAVGAPLDTLVEPVSSCLAAADECVSSICGFLKSIDVARRGFAWYATAWLVTASFVQATCLIYSPNHALSEGWRTSLVQAVECLQGLGSSLDIAIRAREIIQNVLENRSYTGFSPSGTVNPISATLSCLGVNIPADQTLATGQPADGQPPMWTDDCFSWFSRGGEGSDQFLGATGGLAYGNMFDMS